MFSQFAHWAVVQSVMQLYKYVLVLDQSSSWYPKCWHENWKECGLKIKGI